MIRPALLLLGILCALCVSAVSPRTADLNADGVVNGEDLAELLSQWGTPGSPAESTEACPPTAVFYDHWWQAARPVTPDTVVEVRPFEYENFSGAQIVLAWWVFNGSPWPVVDQPPAHVEAVIAFTSPPTQEPPLP